MNKSSLNAYAMALVGALVLAGCASYSGIAPETSAVDATSLKGANLGATGTVWPKDA